MTKKVSVGSAIKSLVIVTCTFWGLELAPPNVKVVSTLAVKSLLEAEKAVLGAVAHCTVKVFCTVPVSVTAKVAFPPATFSATLTSLIDSVATSLSSMVEVADGVPVICWFLLSKTIIAPVNCSCGSTIKSPKTSTGIFTVVCPAGIVH